jgi:hypothetical protein
LKIKGLVRDRDSGINNLKGNLFNINNTGCNSNNTKDFLTKEGSIISLLCLLIDNEDINRYEVEIIARF